MKVSILKFCCGKGVLSFKLYLPVGEKYPYLLGQFSCKSVLASWTELSMHSCCFQLLPQRKRWCLHFFKYLFLFHHAQYFVL